MSEDLFSLLRNLAQINKAIEFRLESKKIAEEALKKTPEYYIVQADQAELKELQETDAELRTAIRELAYDLSKVTDFENRAPADGVKIKHFDIVTITDEKVAKVWLANNAPSCLSIKKSDAERILKALELDFVTKSEEFRVEIATDLSGYLPKEE